MCAAPEAELPRPSVGAAPPGTAPVVAVGNSAIGDYDDALMFLRSGTAFVKAAYGGVAHYACTLWLAVEGGGMQLRWSRNTSGKVSFMDLGDVARVGLLGSRSVVVEAAGDRTKKFKLARPGLAQQYLACLELVLAARRGRRVIASRYLARLELRVIS